MRTFLLTCLFVSFISSAFCQVTSDTIAVATPQTAPAAPVKEKKKFDPSKLVFGGNLGVTFGDYTFVNISPQVGYMFSPIFTGGAGINYVHSSYKVRDNAGNEAYTETYNYAGLNIFGRIFPTNFLFAMIQPEMNYSWGKYKFENSNQPDIEQKAEWIPTLLVGAGVMVGGRGGRGGLMLSIQYDLAQNPRSPYGTNPFVGMGFSF